MDVSQRQEEQALLEKSLIMSDSPSESDDGLGPSQPLQGPEKEPSADIDLEWNGKKLRIDLSLREWVVICISVCIALWYHTNL